MKTKYESGRSMVEMLGVLAVVGVLSVAALAGYNLAMNRHWANELLDEANKRAISAMTQIDNGGNVTLGDFTDNVFRGGEFDTAVQVWNNEFGIRVNNVPEAVCQNLTKMTAGTISVAKVSEENGKDDITAENCESENNLYIVYEYKPDVPKTTTCNDDGDQCITCRGPAKCSYYGSCICGEPGQSVACNLMLCIACDDGETAQCAGTDGGCICAKEGQTTACNNNDCIACSTGETPKCASDNCICEKPGQSSVCNDSNCVACDAGETPFCAGYDGDCVCVREGETTACNDYYDPCIICQGTAKCANWGRCVCEKPGQSAACNFISCIACDAGKTAQCDGEYGDCTCQ